MKYEKKMRRKQLLIFSLLIAMVLAMMTPLEDVFASTLKKGDDLQWYYVNDDGGKENYTGLCQYNGSWWYVKNGKVDFSYTGLCQYNGSWWYVKSGKVDFSVTTLCKYNGSWWYVEKGKVNFTATTLCKYNGSWWYVEKGKVNFTTTTLCRYNGSWWYVKSGLVDFSYTGLWKYNGTWWYVKNGLVDFSVTTLVKYNGTWWYVKNGSINYSAPSLCLYGGTWWYVENGKVNFSGKGICYYNGTGYYVQNGKVNFGYSGTYYDSNNVECTIEKGIVKERKGLEMENLVSSPNESTIVDTFGMCYGKNFLDKVRLCWGGKNLTGKQINYYTVKLYFYNSVGDPAYDEHTGLSYKVLKYVGPVSADGDLIIFSDVGYVPTCSKIVVGEMVLEYADGTKDSGWYGYYTTTRKDSIL